MKKILILAMSCNQDFFIDQEKHIKKLYAKDIIEGKYPNIEFYTYTASYDSKYHINKQLHKLYVPADDSLIGTFEKTLNTFKLSKHLNFDYDYILRTNCSTYINVELLNRFINEIELNDKHVYTGSIYLSESGTGPYNWCFYGVGNALLLSKFWVDVIITHNPKDFKNYVKTPDENYYKIDDNTLGLIINSYAFKNKWDMYNLWESFKFPGINTVPLDPENYIIIPYREYNVENTRNNEKQVSLNIHKRIKQCNIKKIDISNILDNQMIHILVFDKGMHSFVTREFAEQFLNCMSLPRYLKIYFNTTDMNDKILNK